MKVSEQIEHESQTIINIVRLSRPNARDLAQLQGCIRRIQELSKLFAIGFDTLHTLSEC